MGDQALVTSSNQALPARALQLHGALSSTIAPATEHERLVYLLLEVTGGENGHSLPSNLGFILDTSDSMRIRLVTDAQFTELARNGQAQEVMMDGVPAYNIQAASSDVIAKFPRRIDYVSEALKIAGEYLRSVDYFSVVAFAGRAHCMISSVSGKEKPRLQQAARELEYMQLGDGTHIAEGIALAMDEIQRNHHEKLASRLILLTDGHTQRVKECYDWARRARQAGVKLTTMGIGVEFNEELLIPLADITGGSAYYIETPEQIPDAFRRELGAALNIAYRNVEIKIQLPNRVELRRVHRVLPEISYFDPGPNLNGQPGPGGSYSLDLGDYDPSWPQALLLELLIPPWPVGNYRILQAMLAWDDASGAPLQHSPRLDVLLTVSSKATAPLDGRVMNLIEKVGAFKMGTQALKAAEQAGKNASEQEKQAATVRLRQAATRLLDMGEFALADSMMRQADALEQHGNTDPSATKRLRYETRRMTRPG